MNTAYTFQLLRQATITLHFKKAQTGFNVYCTKRKNQFSYLSFSQIYIHDTLLILYYVAKLTVTFMITVTACVVAVQYT
jgi:hypothetical protein